MATSPDERIQALDVLRGFALCGIVFINIVTGWRWMPIRAPEVRATT